MSKTELPAAGGSYLRTKGGALQKQAAKKPAREETKPAPADEQKGDD